MNGLKRVRARHTDALTQVDWRQLEMLLAVYYRGQGYEVEHVGTGVTGARSDGGIDLKLRRGDEYILVQVKHWNACQVPHNAVHELLGLMVNEGATGAVLITSGEFTNAASEAATRHGHVQLVDGHELRRMLGPVAAPMEVEEPSDRASAIADAVSGDRETGRRRPSPNAARLDGRGTAVWWIVAAVGAIAFLLLVRALLDKTQWSAGTAGTTGAAQPLDGNSASDGWQTLRVDGASFDSSATADASMSSPGEPCRELIDHVSGTYVDHCGAATPTKPPSEAELGELQRRADEAIKVLEATTPEM